MDVYLIQWVLRAHELAHELRVIDNGDHAMDYINRLAHEERRRSPTIMLLDLNLPQRDGKELLQRVKAIPQGSDIRVVIVTNSSNPADRRETFALGADAYFVKPYHLTEFMQLLSPTAKNGMQLTDQRGPFSFKTDSLHRLQVHYLHR